MYEGKLTADEPSCFKRHSASCLADFSRYSKRLMLQGSTNCAHGDFHVQRDFHMHEITCT